MRALVLILALTMACATVALAEDMMKSDTYNSNVPAGTGAGTSGVCPTPTAMTAGDQVADQCMANAIGLSRTQVTQLRAKGLSYSDIATAQAISAKSGKSVDDVVMAWQSDKNWPDVAKRYNLSMSDLNTSMMYNKESESFNTSFIARYYGITEAQVSQLRRDGFSWDEINMISNAAARTNQSVQQIAMMRTQGMSWNDIATKYNVAVTDLTAPAPRRVAYAASGAGPVVVAPMVVKGFNGNALLTAEMAQQYTSMGVDWLDLAIATNVARATGVPIATILSQVRAGSLWRDVLTYYNVPPEIAFNVADYPFPKTTNYSDSIEMARLTAIQQYQKPCVIEEGCPVMMRPMTGITPTSPTFTGGQHW